jgi:hypothetical protein
MVTSPSWRTHQVTTPSNKGMKLTKPEHIGALQLIPGVRRTLERMTDGRQTAGRKGLQLATTGGWSV